MSRTLTAGAQAWATGGANRSFSYDWLVESQELDLHWAFTTTSGGGHTWEHRLLTISEIELSVPPGGGLASAQTVTITVAESDTGQSLRATFDEEGRMQGADLTVSLLPEGETYGNKIPLFTGRVDAVSWDAGTDTGGGIGTLIAVDDTLHKDIQVPNRLLTLELFPNLPEQWRGAIVPLVYGSSSLLALAPLLMLDSTTFLYRVADHGLGAMGNAHAVAVAEGARFLALAGAANTNAPEASLILHRPVTETRYLVPGQAQTLTHQVNVTNGANFIDNNHVTLTQIRTSTLNSNGDGYGRLAVKYTWPQPDGANTALLTLHAHRRNPAGATTTAAELIVRSLNSATNAIQRDNLFRDGPYRHASNPRTREVTLTPLSVVSPAALEVELEVVNEGGAGTAAEYWEAGELTLVLFYQADNLFTPIFLSPPWEGRADATGAITGVPGQTLLHAVDVLQSLLQDRLALTAQPTSFPATKAALLTYQSSTYRFDFGLGSGGWYQTQITASALLDSLALQARCYLFPAGDGSIGIGKARDVLISQLALGIEHMANVQIDLGRLELVHSTFEVRYGWSVTLQRFTKVAFATPEGCNHPVEAADLFVKCNDSFQRYGPQQPYILDAFAIQDDATAFTLLAHLVNYYWTQQVMVTCDIPFLGIHLEVGDYIQIFHNELPLNDRNGLFEIVRLTHRPEDGNTTSWPIQCVALRTTLPTFDYFAIKDQNGITWYWWINRAGELDWSLTPPTIGTRIADNLDLSPTPSWLEVEDPAGNTRYIFPSVTTGEPDVSFSQPATGVGYLGSPVVRGQGIGKWTLDVPLTREVRVVSIRPAFDYFAIIDQTGITWYWWINRAGELEAGVTPPSLNTRIALNLNLSPTPSWLIVTDPTPATRYLYPSALTGEPLVASTQPSVGTGHTGSPTLRSMGTGVWQLDVGAAQEVLIVAV